MTKPKAKPRKRKAPIVLQPVRENPPEVTPVGTFVRIPLEKVLALVFNAMDPEAHKETGLQMLAEHVGTFSAEQQEHFCLKQVPKLPGYSLRDGLRILDCLTRWRLRYFDSFDSKYVYP